MQKISGIILAGGQGRRMGGTDKGLQLLRDKPLVAWVLERLAPQVDELLISANRNLEAYARFGYRVIPDETGSIEKSVEKFAGPLAGLQQGLKEAAHPLVITVPCDSPFLPVDLAQRLYTALNQQNAQLFQLAVAKTFDQPHPVFCLCRRDVLPHLDAFLKTGGRKFDTWYSTLKVTEVNFDDEAEAFGNINTLEELQTIETGFCRVG